MNQYGIGRKIRHYRQDKKLTQQQLADRIGVSWEMVSRYERCISGPFNKLDLIAEALDVSIEELLVEEDEKETKENYEIPLFTSKPKDLKFVSDKTSFFYSCPKWIYLKDNDVFALDTCLVDKEQQGVHYISKNTYPYKKHLVLCAKEDELVVDYFKNQKNLIGVVLAQEIRYV